MIKVSKRKENEEEFVFGVIVEESGSKTNHEVTMKKDFYKDLRTKTSPEEIVKKSFEFLLEREPKESILAEFDIRVISKYFPEYKEKSKEF